MDPESIFMDAMIDEIEKIAQGGGPQAEAPVEEKKFKKGPTEWWKEKGEKKEKEDEEEKKEKEEKKEASADLPPFQAFLAKIAKKGEPMAVGGGGRFEKLKKKISARGGARDPGAVAAAIGRKKYGKKRFQEMAARGK